MACLFLAPLIYASTDMAWLNKLPETGFDESWGMVVDQDQVFVVDHDTSSAVVKEITNGPGESYTWVPRDMAIDSDLRDARNMAIDSEYVYTTSETSQSVRRMNKGTHALSANRAVTVSNPRRIAVTDSWVWLGGSDGEFSVVAKDLTEAETNTFTVEQCDDSRSRITGMGPVGDNKVVLGCVNEKHVYIYSTTDSWVSATKSQSSQEMDVKFGRGRMASIGTMIFVLCETTRLYKYDTESDNLQAIDILTGAGSSQVGGFHVDSTHLYFANGDDSSNKPKIHQVSWNSDGGTYLGGVGEWAPTVVSVGSVLARFIHCF
jgi:hypothetical protein